MDKVIVTALLVIASVTGAVIAMNSMIPAITKAGQSLSQSNDVATNRINTSIQVLTVSADSDEETIDAWIKNLGTRSIGPIRSVDVFLITPTESHTWLEHNLDVVPGSWQETPLGATWNAGEVLHIQIRTPQDFPAASRFHILKISTPNGSVTEQPFERW